MAFIRKCYLFLAVYLPFESYVAAWVFRSDTGVLLAKQFSDGVVILSLIIFLLARMQNLNAKIVDICRGGVFIVLFFSVYAIVTTLLNGGDLVIALLQLKAAMRYLVVAYVIANIGFTPAEWQRFLRFFSIAAMINMVLAIFQLISPSAASMVSPFGFIGANTDSVLVSTSVTETSKGIFAYGAALNTIEFAYFLVAWWIVYFAANRRRESGSLMFATVSFFIVAILIYFSGSKIAVLAFLFSGLMYFTRVLAGRSLLYLKLLVSIIALMVVLSMASAFGMFQLDGTDFFSFATSDYLAIARLQRLGIVISYVEIAGRLEWPFFFGFGSEPTQVVELMSQSGLNIPYLLTFSPNSIEDVYWIANLFYYGVVGGGALYFLLAKIYFRSSKIVRNTKIPTLYHIHFAVMIMFIFMIITGFFNQILDVKPFSYYFWILIGYGQFYFRQYGTNKVSATRSVVPNPRNRYPRC
jgi:hypothetical protein